LPRCGCFRGGAAELAQIYGVSVEEEQAKLTLADYFDSRQRFKRKLADVWSSVAGV